MTEISPKSQPGLGDLEDFKSRWGAVIQKALPPPGVCPCPASPWRGLCAELLEELDHLHSNYDVPRQSALIDRALNALAQPETERPTEADMNDMAGDMLGVVLPEGSGARLITRALELWGRPTLEPRGCPTPGACSSPTTSIVPPDLIRALELAESSMCVIADLDCCPTPDDLKDAMTSATADLPRIRQVLNMWRDHARELEELTDEELDSEIFRGWSQFYEEESPFGGPIDQKKLDRAKARAVLARWGRPAIKPVPVSERLPGPEDCDAERQVWTTEYKCDLVYNPVWTLTELPRQELNEDFSNAYFWRNVTYWAPCWALPTPNPIQSRQQEANQ